MIKTKMLMHLKKKFSGIPKIECPIWMTISRITLDREAIKSYSIDLGWL